MAGTWVQTWNSWNCPIPTRFSGKTGFRDYSDIKLPYFKFENLDDSYPWSGSSGRVAATGCRAPWTNFTLPSRPCSTPRDCDMIVVENSEVTDSVHARTCSQKDRPLIWTQLPWWTLLQNWACRHMRSQEFYSAPSSSETGDRDLFRGTRQWIPSVSLTRPIDHSLLHSSPVAPRIGFFRKLIKWHWVSRRQKWLIETAFWQVKGHRYFGRKM